MKFIFHLEASNRYFSSGRNDSSPDSDDETSSLSVHREAPKRMLHDEQKPIQKERHRRFNSKKFVSFIPGLANFDIFRTVLLFIYV